MSFRRSWSLLGALAGILVVLVAARKSQVPTPGPVRPDSVYTTRVDLIPGQGYQMWGWHVDTVAHDTIPARLIILCHDYQPRLPQS